MKQRGCYVYFIRPVGMRGPIKVGSSQSPEGRRGTLATWSPFPLEIIAQIEGNSLLERRFHAYFKDTYERREWFGWSPLFDETVAAINAGTFDIAALPDPARIGKIHFRRKRWSTESRTAASYIHRLRHARNKYGLLPRETEDEPVWKWVRDGNEQQLRLLDQFLADPVAHGCTWEQKYRLQDEAA